MWCADRAVDALPAKPERRSPTTFVDSGAETFAEQWRGVPGHAYEHGFDLQLRPRRLLQPHGWTEPLTIFVNSMSDLFHVDVPRSYIDQVWDVT